MEKRYLTLHEAAELLSASMLNEHGQRMPMERMWRDMKDAFLAAILTFYDEYRQPIDPAKLRRMNAPDAGVYAEDYNLLGMYGETTTPEAINQWLKNIGSPNRLPVDGDTSHTASLDSHTTTEPPMQVSIMKKKDLIAELEHKCPTVEKDLSEATRNGLNDAAKAAKHGEWCKEKALNWAQSKGKLKQSPRLSGLGAVWTGTVVRNTMR